MRHLYPIILIFVPLFLTSCKTTPDKPVNEGHIHDDTGGFIVEENVLIDKNRKNENPRLQYKLVHSRYQKESAPFQPFVEEIENLTEQKYLTLANLIVEKDIPTLQSTIANGDLTYEELTLFYLKRMYDSETNPSTSLHAIIALNAQALKQARAKDQNTPDEKHPIYGMPILLKDNIDTKDMKTTAGAVVLQENQPSKNAFIVDRLEENGALILGKVNLSEWAYYFCNGCPLGYSAIGGQTLNPYGRGQFETGGSSAGSGVSVAANYAVAAIGSETSGSIISPSSQNSVVGLKPTPGVLSRTGIVPISHTLDTPGPMAKSVVDAAIVMDAMGGKDEEDLKSVAKKDSYMVPLQHTLKGKRLGVFKPLLEDEMYAQAIDKLREKGAVIIEITPEELPLPSFLTLLNLEMKEDLPIYLSQKASSTITVKNLAEVMAFNSSDSTLHMPYNQGIFDGIMADSTNETDFTSIKKKLEENGTAFFQNPIKINNLDAVLSINNYHSGFAAVGLHPCLAIPMGLQETGEPKGMTLISSPYSEKKLLEIGIAVESALQGRVTPTIN